MVTMPLFAPPALPPRLSVRRPRVHTCRVRMADDGTADGGAADAAAGAAGANKAAARPNQYSQRARLREETEAPFRKVRMFVLAGSAASAAVGALVAALRVVAALAGASAVQPLTETVPNVAIDLAVVAGCVALLRRERAAGERRLERMSRGARLAALKASDGATGRVVPLSSLRGEARVVILAGGAARVLEALRGAEAVRDELRELDLRVAPLIVDEKWNERPAEIPREFWVLDPVARGDWLQWYDIEREAARASLGAAVDDILVIIVRLDGKVGARNAGLPLFDSLVAQVRRLPTKDQYGRP